MPVGDNPKRTTVAMQRILTETIEDKVAKMKEWSGYIGITGQGIPIKEVKPKVLQEIHLDKKAAYGYSPNLGTVYSKYDFTDIQATKNNRVIREKYLQQSNEIQKEIDIMTKRGCSKEEIANKVVNVRNQDKIDARASMNSIDLEPIEKRNMELYGNKIGPDATWLFNKKKIKLKDLGIYQSDDEIWDAVIAGSMKKDDVLNTLLGLKH